MASLKEKEGYKKSLAKLKEVEAKYKGKPLTTAGMREILDARREVSSWTETGAFGKGVGRAVMDTITGIPDLAAMGVNYGIRKLSDSERPFQFPVIGDEYRKAGGIDGEQKTPDLQFAYDVPGYVATAIGVKQLAQGLWKGYKSLRNNSKFKKFLGELPTDEANAFKQYMVNGQGSDSPIVQSAIERMRNVTEYKELFNTLEEGAARAGAKVASVRPSTQTAEEATTGITNSMEKVVEAVKKARDDAGLANFNAAVEAGGNRAIISPEDTLTALRNLRKRFKTDTPEGQAALRYISQVEESFSARIPMGDKELILGSIKPKLTVSQVQNKLREFGAQIGGNDAAVNSLSVNTKDLINKAVFGGMKGDLAKAGAQATTTADKKAVGFLVKAREQYSTGTTAYNDFVAKGIPKFLRDKPVNEIELADLTKAYEGLSGSQRKLFRTWVGESRPESLQAIDKAVFDAFKGTAFKPSTGGKQNYDLGVLAREWEKIRKTDPERAAMITDALGVSATEFSARMKDALVFSRRMDVGSAKQAGDAIQNQQQAAATAGAIGGYPAAKITDLTIEAVNTAMKQNGISDETLMKLLLTPEGAAFLKSAKLSPQGRETLEKLTQLEKAVTPSTAAYLVGGGQVQANIPQEELEVPDELPPEFMEEEVDISDMEVPDELPPEFMQPSEASEQPTSDPMGEFIQGLPQQTSEAPVAPQPQMVQQPQLAPQPQLATRSVAQQPQQVAAAPADMVYAQLMKMKQSDPNLNVDYMMRAYEQAPEQEKRKVLGMFS